MLRVAVFCLGGLFSSLSAASDLAVRYHDMWVNAKWENDSRCGQIKENLLSDIRKQLAKRSPSLNVVGSDFESSSNSDSGSDLKEECRIFRNGFLSIANGDVCRTLVFSNKFMMLDQNNPHAYVRLECIGIDKRPQFVEATIRLGN
jgi:hypothetical protein